MENTSQRGSQMYCVSVTCNLHGPFETLDQRSNTEGVLRPFVRYLLCGSAALHRYFRVQPDFLGSLCEKNWPDYQLL